MRQKLGFNRSFEHEVQTPTVFLTITGFTLLFAYVLTKNKWTVLMSHILLNLAGGGVAIALASEVRDKNHVWGWQGINKSVRKPTKRFLYGVFGHLPQLIIASIIAIVWWKNNNVKS